MGIKISSLSAITVGVLLGVGRGMAVGAQSPLEVIRSELKAARSEAQEAERPRSQKPVTAADRVFGVPAREERIAAALAELVKSGRPSLRATEWKRVYRQRQNDAASREDLRHLKETIEQAEEDDERTTQARSQLGSALSSLTKLADPRVVRFVAPLLADSAAPIIVGREVSPPAQERAAFILWDMSVQGLIELGDPRHPFNLEETRAWWQKNRTTFGNVPQTLRPIDRARRDR